ncbi:PD-(D/E)XK motif protein [Cystobacter fuscus]|uniref:PD-(D/E)XK motif protein n=1 Tax=Cystobacter fuscus TaxID=43 RepID=UPI00138B093C|nr:PD-(D/E)XK motif protein [Cystobacter fuscus]
MTWENFWETFIAPGVPALHRVRHAISRDVEFFVDTDASRLGLRTATPVDKLEVASPLAAIEVGLRTTGGTNVLEIATRTVALYQQFYAFMMDVADRIQLSSRQPATAISESLEDWKELLRESTVLSAEAQTGLFGELWLLKRLHQAHGTRAVDAWVGPLGESHDFRYAGTEFEVKTTRSADRVHVISGLHQLEPSSGRSLYLVSLQMEPIGSNSGESLPDRVAALRKVLATSSEQATKFEKLLNRTGYRNEDAVHYRSKLSLRTPPLLVPVDRKCPRLIPEHVRKVLGEVLAARVRDVRYRVNLSGLGFEDGTPEFLRMLP